MFSKAYIIISSFLFIYLFLSCSISEISLTVAEEGRPSKDSEKAHQIEKCHCPIGYSGLSCEVGEQINVYTQVLRRSCCHISRLEINLQFPT